jgi:hypothetical protein
VDEQISAYLRDRGLAFAMHNGVHVVPYGSPDTEDQPPQTIVLIWSGADAVGGVMVELHAAALPDDTDEVHLLRRCNEWNRASRATKARLERLPDLTIVLESWLPSSEDVPQRVLYDFLDRALSDMLAPWPDSAQRM